MLDTISLWLSDALKDHFWMFKVFIVVFITMCLHALEAAIYRKSLKKVQKTKNYWDETIITALHLPLGVLIWLLGICFAAEIAGNVNGSSVIFNYVPHLRRMGILVLIAWFAMRFVRTFEINYLKHAQQTNKVVDKTLIHALAQLLTISVIITSVLIGMQIFGLPISGLLAFGGIGGAGIAFASKDLLANFFGGLVIYVDRPFKVGDWIRSPDRNIEGTVEYIGWRMTRIRTFDKRPLYVPNGTFLTISVENPSRMTNRRIKTNVGVRYDDASKLEQIIRDVEIMLKNHEEIDTNQTLIVNLVEFGPSSLNFMIYTFTKTTNWIKFQAIQQDVFIKVINIIEGHGAECAFPTTTLHIPDGITVNQQG